jgi:putative inorganic carbon (hco3(-)) transporter
MQLSALKNNNFLYVWLVSLVVLILIFNANIPALALITLVLSALAIVLLNWQKYLLIFFLFVLPFSFDLEVISGSNVAFFAEPIAMLLSPVFFVLLWQRRKTTQIFSIPIFWAAILFIAPLIFSAFFSELPIVSLKFVAVNLIFLVSGCFLTFLLLEDNTITIAEIISALVLGLTLISFYAYFNFGWMGFIPDSGNALSRPFFKDHTIFSATLALTVPLGFFLLSTAKEKRQKTRIWAWILLIFITILVSSSRAAWISVIIAWSLFAMIRAGLRLYQLFFFLMLLTSVILLNLRSIESIVLANRNDSNRFQSTLREQALSVTNVTNDVSNLERINRWKCALRMGRDKPLTGYGPGTFQFLYLPYQLNSEMTRISVQSQFFIKEGKGGTAHSEYLLSLSEGGIPALLSWVFLIGVLFIQSFSYLRVSRNKENKYLVTLLITGLTTYFIHAFFNNFLNTINFGVYFWVVVGLLMFVVSKREHDVALSR